MIEAEFATRLGISHRFLGRGDTPADTLAIDRLALLGIRHLRVVLDDADDVRRLGALLGSLGGIEVLPSLHLDHPSSGELLDALLGAAREPAASGWRAVEISGADDAVALAAQALRDAGILPVLGLDLTAADSRLESLADHVGPALFAAIGLRQDLRAAAGTWQAGVVALADRMRLTYPGLALWITDAGYSTWRGDEGRQAQVLLDLLALPAARLYWTALADAPALSASDPLLSQSGLFDAAGPKLLGRLLAQGVGEVDRVTTLARRMRIPAITGTRPVLITGGAGFIGANLTDRLAAEGHPILIYDALARPGVERNLRWLAQRHPTKVSFTLGDVRDQAALTEAARSAQAVFHLAGQVAVTTSMVQPVGDFEINARGTLTLLEALRQHNPQAPLVFASTNKVYGDLADIELVRIGESYLPAATHIRQAGVDEQRPLCFHTPYGCSKGTADQYVLDYAHSFGLRTAVLRMSCIYGERQLGTEDQGWVAHFLLKAIAGEGLTLYGDGRQVRDVMHVGDAVGAYVAAWSRIDDVSGRAFNLGGGPANAISLLQLIAHIEDLLGRRIDVGFADWRPGDQRYFVADTASVRRALDLPAALGWREGVARLAAHFGAIDAAGVAGVAAQ